MPELIEGSKSRVPPPPPHQHTLRTCWGTRADGKPCPGKVETFGRKEIVNDIWQYMPYCAGCQKNGDPSVKAIPHPTKPYVGNILIAERDLPAGYRFIYWGTRKVGYNMTDDDRALEFMYGNRNCGAIDPGPHKGSVLQFAANPGPGEWFNMITTAEHFGRMDDDRVGRMYKLIRPVQKGHQVAHDYGKGWLEQRGIKGHMIADCGTDEHPLPKRLSKRYVSQTQAGRFVAQALVDGKLVSLGAFDSEEEAVRKQRAVESGKEPPPERKPTRQERADLQALLKHMLEKADDPQTPAKAAPKQKKSSPKSGAKQKAQTVQRRIAKGA